MTKRVYSLQEKVVVQRAVSSSISSPRTRRLGKASATAASCLALSSELCGDEEAGIYKLQDTTDRASPQRHKLEHHRRLRHLQSLIGTLVKCLACTLRL